MRTKSIVKQLRDSITQLDALLNNNDHELKTGKKADILMEKAQLQRLLLQHEKDERETNNKAKIEELTIQHDADASRIRELETELQSKPREVVRTVLDENHEATLEKNGILSAVLKQIVASMNDTERQVIVVRTCQSYGNGDISLEVAREIAAACRLEFNEQMQMSLEYEHKGDKALEDLIAQHEISGVEGGITRFVRALLVVRCGGLPFNLTIPRRRLDDFV